jgi:hypothetical protein
MTWSVVYLFWVLVTCLRSAEHGMFALLSHLPSHLLIAAPYFASFASATPSYPR